MSHETMSCLTQSLLSAIEEEDDGASQLDVKVGNEHSGCLQQGDAQSEAPVHQQECK